MGQRMNLLIVDDDARFRQTLKDVLAGLGTVWEAADGAQALASCEAHRPDWVLMDLRMKPVNGLVATRGIKARFPHTRVLIITQFQEASLEEAAREAGACHYMLKENLAALPQLLQRET